MSKYYSTEELEGMGEAVVMKFYGSGINDIPEYVDIVALASGLFGLTVINRRIMEDHKKQGFLSDGKYPLEIMEGSKVKKVVYPKGTIVIDSKLLAGDPGRRRFCIAHEVAHYILNGPVEACFKDEFDKMDDYKIEELKKMFSPTEYQVDNLAAALLMPRHVFCYSVASIFGNKKIPVYGNHIFKPVDQIRIQQLKKKLGVSFTALFIRLKTYGFLEEHTYEEYLENEVGAVGPERYL